MEVKVYSTPTCPWCTKVKEYLKDKGVAFTSVDVSQDRAAARDMVARTGQMGVPVIDIANSASGGLFNQVTNDDLDTAFRRVCDIINVRAGFI